MDESISSMERYAGERSGSSEDEMASVVGKTVACRCRWGIPAETWKKRVSPLDCALAWWANAASADEEWRDVVCQVVEALRNLRVAGGKLPVQDVVVKQSRKRKCEGNEDMGNDSPAGRPLRQTKSVWVCLSCLATCIDFFF
jgi:hypothetical protein